MTRTHFIFYLILATIVSEKITHENWGAGVIEKIAADLQSELPGLRGFSRRSLMKMKQFYETYSDFSIVPLPTAQLKSTNKTEILQLPTAKFDDAFFGISFTHHLLLINKCKH